MPLRINFCSLSRQRSGGPALTRLRRLHSLRSRLKSKSLQFGIHAIPLTSYTLHAHTGRNSDPHLRYHLLRTRRGALRRGFHGAWRQRRSMSAHPQRHIMMPALP